MYRKEFKGVNYKLEDLQNLRVTAEEESKPKIQEQIDAHFFGPQGRRKTKKERRKDLKRERQKNREDDYA